MPLATTLMKGAAAGLAGGVVMTRPGLVARAITDLTAAVGVVAA